MIEIKKINFDSLEYWGIVRLREMVLRLPINMRFSSIELTKEVDEWIFGLYEEHTLLSSCQFIIEDEKAKLRQVATSIKKQSRGYGKLLNSYTENYLISKGIREIYCHARVTAVPFYKGLGYEVCSESFYEVGIEHYKMKKSIS